MFACSRVCTQLHTNSDTESEWNCFRCAHGLTHGILPDLGRITGCNVWRTSLQELPVTGASGSVKTCLAESVSVICFKCAVIVSGLSTACFPPLLLKSPLESRSVGPECKAIHVQGAGILNIQANCRVGENNLSSQCSCAAPLQSLLLLSIKHPPRSPGGAVLH